MTESVTLISCREIMPWITSSVNGPPRWPVAYVTYHRGGGGWTETRATPAAVARTLLVSAAPHAMQNLGSSANDDPQFAQTSIRPPLSLAPTSSSPAKLGSNFTRLDRKSTR